jgi:hypothetical protein
VSSKALILFDTLVLTISGLGTRDAAVEAGRLVTAHLDAIQDAQAVRFGANQYDILQTIDIPLSQAVDKLIDQGIVAIKTGLQDILRDPLGLNIGFLFQKEPPFSEGIAVLRASGENDLAQYLEDVRVGWLSHFHKYRPTKSIARMMNISGLVSPVNSVTVLCGTIRAAMATTETTNSASIVRRFPWARSGRPCLEGR